MAKKQPKRRTSNRASSEPETGTYVYDPLHHRLLPVVFQEPGLRDPEVQRSYYYLDTGMIAANVYLFAASVGLAAWFHNCDRSRLAARLGLRDDQRVLFAQTLGQVARKRARR